MAIELNRCELFFAPLLHFYSMAWLFIGILLVFIRSTFHLFCCHYLFMIYACCARSRFFMRIISISCCAFPFKFDTKNARVRIRSHASLTTHTRSNKKPSIIYPIKFSDREEQWNTQKWQVGRKNRTRNTNNKQTIRGGQNNL